MEEKKKKSHSFALPLLAAGGAAAAVSHNRRRQPSHLPSSEKQSKVIPPFSAGTAALSFFQSNQWNIWFDERERLDCSLGAAGSANSNQINSSFPILKEKRRLIDWFEFRRGHKSFMNQSKVHSLIPQKQTKVYFYFINSFHFCFIHLNFYTLVLL